MRMSLCYRLIRSKGFFLGKWFYEHPGNFSGFNVPIGLGQQPKKWLLALSDGFAQAPKLRASQWRVVGTVPRRWQNATLVLLRFVSPLREPHWSIG